jgi:hypothetical protein
MKSIAGSRMTKLLIVLSSLGRTFTQRESWRSVTCSYSITPNDKTSSVIDEQGRFRNLVCVNLIERFSHVANSQSLS